ncbi:MAG: hypothetical protein HOP11_05265 [Saprospiraceae bacterium]|nr:hypothetical protein [Saprospiraceae bacterium]
MDIPKNLLLSISLAIVLSVTTSCTKEETKETIVPDHPTEHWDDCPACGMG